MSKDFNMLPLFKIVKAGSLKYKRTKSIKERYFVLRGAVSAATQTPLSTSTTVNTITNSTTSLVSNKFDPFIGIGANGAGSVGGENARLECYESERKFRHGSPCKASIILKECFNISFKYGTKDSDHMMFIFTKQECYTFYFTDERLLQEWFTLLIDLSEFYVKSSRYQRVWQVTIPKNQNSERENLTGTYRLCLTNDKKLHLVKVAHEPEPIHHELPLSCVRRFSHNKKYFIVELGRGAALGAGNLCMLTDDGATTHDMHESILRAIDYQPTFLLNKVSTNGSLQNLRTPIHHSVYDSETTLRPRSASTSECCRPISFSRGRRISRENTIGGGMSNPQAIPIGIPPMNHHHNLHNNIHNGNGSGCSSHSSGHSSQSHSLTSPGSYYDIDEINDDDYVPMKPLDLSSSEALELSVNSTKSSLDSPSIFNAAADLSLTGMLRH